MKNGKKHIGLTIGFWVLMLGAGFVWKGIATVQPGEIGILVSFSHAWRTPLEPGLHFVIPFVQHVKTVRLSAIRKEVILSEAKKVRTAKKSFQQSKNPKSGNDVDYFLTSDENLVTFDASVQYRIKEPWSFTFNSRDRDEIVRDLARHVLVTQILATPVDDVLSRGRSELLHELHSRLQKECSDLKLGILVTSFLIGDVVPPKAAIPAFQKVSDARAEAGQILSQAQANAMETKAKARGQASKQLAGASSYSADKMARARGGAEQFDKLSAEYAKAPNLLRRRLSLDAQKGTFPKVKKIYYDPRHGVPSVRLSPR